MAKQGRTQAEVAQDAQDRQDDGDWDLNDGWGDFDEDFDDIDDDNEWFCAYDSPRCTGSTKWLGLRSDENNVYEKKQEGKKQNEAVVAHDAQDGEDDRNWDLRESYDDLDDLGDDNEWFYSYDSPRCRGSTKLSQLRSD